MEVNQYSENKQRIFDLTLEQEDLKILSYLDSQGIWSPYTESGVRFWLLPGSRTSSSFQILTSGVGGEYYAYIDVSTIRTINDLENILKNISRIPMEMPSSIEGTKPINTGYVNFEIQ